MPLTFKCCKKSQNNWVCIKCTNIFHKSCRSRGVRGVEIVKDNFIICSKECSDLADEVDPVMPILRQTIEQLNVEIDDQNKHIEKMKMEKNALVTEFESIESQLVQEIDSLKRKVNDNRKPVADAMVTYSVAQTQTERIEQILLLILGDQNGYGLGSLIQSSNEELTVQSIIKPNAMFADVIEDMANLSKYFTLEDFVLVLAGYNDLKNKKYSSFKSINSIFKKLGHTNLIVLSVPYKNNCDFTVNRAIFRFNYKLCLYMNRLNQFVEGTGASTRNNILEAAKNRNDTEMISLLANYLDLFAYNCKYHKTCYSQYVSERNIKSKIRNNTDNAKCSGKARIQTENYIKEHVIAKHETLTLAGVCKLYNNIAETVKEISVQSHRLKKMLQEKFPREIEFISRPGKCDIICASDMDRSEYFNSDDAKSNLLVQKRNIFRVRLFHTNSDVRNMTTALAKDGLNTDRDCYKPYELEMVKDDELNNIHASIDNFDLNEDTIDGKNTTHSMALWFFKKNVIFQNQPMKFQNAPNIH
ncbi:unnamed protein product [Ceutorhynchus assimilis]|uniref:Uncharacterized protein n=1 Tax=Ceutorhynchus assimilis TaxID=467358 RepID=A0A9N9QM58_9CUCU|nr:unnamed protein product [Ceutorhynchus assimilis]